MEHFSKSRKFMIRAVTVFLIVTAVAAIWFIKNSQDGDFVKDSSDFALFVQGDFDLEKLKAYRIPIILSFGSEDCPACKAFAPTLKALNEELKGRAFIKYVDVYQNPGLTGKYPLKVIPTQIFIDSNGTPYNPQENTLELQFFQDENTNIHNITLHEGVLSKEQIMVALKEMGMKE